MQVMLSVCVIASTKESVGCKLGHFQFQPPATIRLCAAIVITTTSSLSWLQCVPHRAAIKHAFDVSAGNWISRTNEIDDCDQRVVNFSVAFYVSNAAKPCIDESFSRESRSRGFKTRAGRECHDVD
ncbi:hypothetical protein Ciccas_011766 [Cichlidogyrus casuarinus]|uniref:Secreted protein n=1 Tax=Cichlidogyrus casuarinus TaxID=1844966 RepID=A0ABD2PQB1_9PLAT